MKPGVRSSVRTRLVRAVLALGVAALTVTLGASRADAASVYICDCGTGAAPGCVAGDDANAGACPATPQRTLGRAGNRFGSLAAGDSLLFCRGGAWAFAPY